MIDRKMKAYALAKEAASVDFGGAISGLLAGHADELKRMQDEYAKKDVAFLMALALTEKGKRLDKEGTMRAAIVKGLEGVSLCDVEKRFIEND